MGAGLLDVRQSLALVSLSIVRTKAGQMGGANTLVSRDGSAVVVIDFCTMVANPVCHLGARMDVRRVSQTCTIVRLYMDVYIVIRGHCVEAFAEFMVGTEGGVV